MDRAELEKLDRETLVRHAQAAGLKRARVLTRPELIDELVRRNPSIEPGQMKRSRGFFGLARDLLSRVVERGLHLPDAAERIAKALTEPIPQVPRPEAQAIPTVTLAEIYAAQGHKERAIETLQRVLEDEPEHLAARSLLEKLQGRDYVPPREPLPPEPEYEAPSDDEDEEAIETPRYGEEEELPAAVSASPATLEPMTIALPTPVAAAAEDRCVAVGPYVWWQLSPRSQQLAEESFFFLRILTIVPSWDGPQVSTRDLAADPGSGEHVLHGLPPNAVVRVAIGFMPEGEFVPVAHSPALELGPGSVVRQWTLDPAERSALEDPIIAAVAHRAAERAAEL